ncbi:trehalose-phosphatase [Rhodanobacter sp. IGA1.0]|uniref:Trehalose 6-phosphate phosphatase n=1 Tax=Rhodanobacter sp. IGA1.0 TaxID=3158582 RepID=A0AAU7QIZ6_9GAMM
MSTPRPSTTPTRPVLPAPPLPAAGAGWALLFDVDGTLLDFADDPGSVRVSPALLALLHDVHAATEGAMALVSGRELDDLDRLFERPRWAAIGLHGLELRQASGSFRRVIVPQSGQDHMHREVRALAARFEGVQVEDKQLAVALHCRRAPEQLARLHGAASELMARLPGYELQPGHQVLEFKPAGMDKGRAVTELLQRAPFAGRTPVYLGDDLTDEHAFDAVNRRGGFSIRIGEREPSAAHFTLPGPAATEAWLTRVLHALTHGAPTHARLPHGGPARQP